MYQNNRYPKPRPKSKVQKLAAPKVWFVAAIALVLVIVLAGGFFVMQGKDKSPDVAKTAKQAATFDKQRYSLTDPASPWIVVNKKRPLDPKDYAPANLRVPAMNVKSYDMQVNDEVATALESLAAAANSDGIDLIVVSAYRSYDMQTTIYNSEVRGFGQEQADRESARPGHSEHQTGWAADLGSANGKCEIKACFADTPEGQWLAKNAHKYGFIIRYAEGKEHVTGYMYEPWHVRYVGFELATEMHNQKTQTLEEFFNLPPAPSY